MVGRHGGGVTFVVGGRTWLAGLYSFHFCSSLFSVLPQHVALFAFLHLFSFFLVCFCFAAFCTRRSTSLCTDLVCVCAKFRQHGVFDWWWRSIPKYGFISSYPSTLQSAAHSILTFTCSIYTLLFYLLFYFSIPPPSLPTIPTLPYLLLTVPNVIA